MDYRSGRSKKAASLRKHSVQSAWWHCSPDKFGARDIPVGDSFIKFCFIKFTQAKIIIAEVFFAMASRQIAAGEAANSEQFRVVRFTPKRLTQNYGELSKLMKGLISRKLTIVF